MKKILAVLAVGIFAVSAVNGKGLIKRRGKDPFRVEKVKAEKNGDLGYIMPGSNVKSKISAGDYEWAWIPMPSALKDAYHAIKRENYKTAFDIFRKSYAKYQYLGYDVLCRWGMAKAKVGTGNDKAAIKILAPLVEYKLKNSRKKDALMEAYKLLSELYIKKGEMNKAKPLLTLLSGAKDDATAAFALIAKGDMMMKEAKTQNQKKDASLEYLQAALVIPKNKGTPVALAKLVKYFKDANDVRAKQFEEKLKKEYPNFKL